MEKKIKNKSVAKIISHIILIIFSVMCVIPFMLLVSSSFTSKDEMLNTGISLIPLKPVVTAYQAVFEYPMRIIRAFGVSIFITVAGTVLNLVLCFLAAYALSNQKFVFKRQISFYFYFTMMFSGELIPYYITCTKYLHLKNSLWALILPMLCGPMTIFLLRTYLQDIPRSLYEAAKIDGASEYGILLKIALPLSKTPLAIVGFQTALSYWNSWYDAMLFMTDSKKYPLQTLLQNIMDYINMLKSAKYANPLMALSIASLPSTSVVAATCVVAVAPMLFAFLLFQKQFVQGITNGAVKE